MPCITGIDHPIIGVRDLEAAAETWRRLGFTLSPRGRHKQWGTANYCIMFAFDYIEILGILDPARYTQGLDSFLEQREGLLGLAFGTEDAETCHATLQAAGIADNPPQDLSRYLDTPDGTEEPQFKLLHPRAPMETIGVNGFICQHLTSDLIRRPGWLAHANGARRVRHVGVAVPNPWGLVPIYTALAGSEAVVAKANGVSVQFGPATVFFGPLDDDLADIAAGSISLLTGLAIEVLDPDKVAAGLSAKGVPFERSSDSVDVPAESATGVPISFVAP